MDIVKVLAPIAIKEATAYLSKRSTSPSTELAVAASKGDTSAVKAILSQDDRVDLAPALVAASTAGKLDVLDILIEPPRRRYSSHAKSRGKGKGKGKNKRKEKDEDSDSSEEEKAPRTDVNVWSSNLTPLIAAVQTHHLKTTELLLDAGADPSLALKSTSETPLHIACRMGDLPIVKLLIQNSASLSARDAHLNTPLLVAARWRHPSVIEHLLKQGADIEAKDAKGSTALLLACRHACVEAVKLLLNSGADVRVRDVRGRGPLHRVVEGVDFIEGVGGGVKEELVRVLLEKGADRRARDGEGRTAGERAGWLRGGDKVARLLSEGVRSGSASGSANGGRRRSHDGLRERDRDRERRDKRYNPYGRAEGSHHHSSREGGHRHSPRERESGSPAIGSPRRPDLHRSVHRSRTDSPLADW
ncbi:ankyrin repeat-containing domain protein [Rutstroemia sp. NJR-2017a BVV2]|nr:ankyrin repeat-containing domain protein [Rutstroemia sp. NJR-2017a BVV2]